MRPKEIRQLPDEEILTEIQKRREEIFRQRLKAGSDDVENPGSLRQKRREIARMLTVLRERQLERERKEKEKKELEEKAGKKK